MEIINFNEFKMKAKVETFKRSAAEKAKKAWNQYWDHKQVTLPLTIAGIGFATKGLVKLSNELAEMREEHHRDLMSWDPRLGEWLELKRKLTNAEKVILDARLADGERKVDILSDLNVLK